MDNQFQSDVMRSLGNLEAGMKTLIGNGKPGRMDLAEARIGVLEADKIGKVAVSKHRGIVQHALIVSVTTLFSILATLATIWGKLHK